MNITATGAFFDTKEMAERNPEELLAEAKNTDIFFKELISLWENNSYFTYRDERTEVLGNKFYVRVNNDGSEDLVRLAYDDDRSWLDVIQQLTPSRCRQTLG